MDLEKLSSKLTTKYGADVSQEALTRALERQLPLSWETCSRLAREFKKTLSTWRVRHLSLKYPDSLYYDELNHRYVLGHEEEETS